MSILGKIENAVERFIISCKSKKLIPIVNTVSDKSLLAGKVALITGGSGGIGLAMAESFVKSGAKVIIAGTNEEKLRSCCEKIGGGG